MKPARSLGIRVTTFGVEHLDAFDSTYNNAYWFDLRTRRPVAARTKRLIDVVGALVMVVLGAPLLLLRRNSVVIQRTAGFRGHEFDRYTFRDGRLSWLPQLYNVLEGTMSLVGPRPLDAGARGDLHMRRYAARPGITGLWRVCAGDRDQLDREYVNRWSVWLDLVILAKSLF